MAMLRLSEEELAKMLAKSKVRVVSPMASTKPSAIRPATHAPAAEPTPAKSPKPRGPKSAIDYARALASQIQDAKLPPAQLEFAFDAQLEGGGRGWRFDLCWPDRRLAIEVDGAVHRIRKQFRADLEKHQQAFFLNYRVLRVSPAQVRDGSALELARRLLS